MLEAIRHEHGLISQVADRLRCSRQTVYNFAQRHPAIAQALDDERERLVDLAEQGLYHHLQENSPWAISMVLRTLGKSRGYGDKPVDPRTDTPRDMRQEIEDSPEWREIRTTMLQTLERFPEARWAVVEALQAMSSHESTNGHHPRA